MPQKQNRGTELKVFDWKEQKQTVKRLQKPLVLLAWNVFVLWGVGKTVWIPVAVKSAAGIAFTDSFYFVDVS